MPDILEALRPSPGGDYLRGGVTVAVRQSGDAVLVVAAQQNSGVFTRNPDGSVTVEAA